MLFFKLSLYASNTSLCFITADLCDNVFICLCPRKSYAYSSKCVSGLVMGILLEISIQYVDDAEVMSNICILSIT